jgi:hypothetical protein
MGGRTTGDMQRVAQVELLGNIGIDVASLSTSYNRRGYWR